MSDDVRVNIFGDATSLLAANQKARQSLKDLAVEGQRTGKSLDDAIAKQTNTTVASYKRLVNSIAETNNKIRTGQASLTQFMAEQETQRLRLTQSIAASRSGLRRTEAAEEADHQQRLAAIDKQYTSIRSSIEAKSQAESVAAQARAEREAVSSKARSKTAITRIIAQGRQEAKAILELGAQEAIRIEEQKATALLAAEAELQAKLSRIRAAGQRTRGAGLGTGYALREAGGTMIRAGLVPLEVGAGAAYAAGTFNDNYLNAVNNSDLNNADRLRVRQGARRIIDKGTDQPISEVFDAFKQASDFRKDGQSFADTYSIVDVAIKAASADNAKAGETTAALARAMFQFNAPARDAGRIMNVLEVVAAKNNLTLEQLTENSGRAAAAAAEFKVPLQEVIAAYGVLTKEGYSAGQSATALRSIFKSISDPSIKSQKAIVELSKKFGDLSLAFGPQNLAANGLAGTFDLLNKKLHGNQEALLRLFPDARSNVAVMALMGDRNKDLTLTINEANKAWLENSRIQGQYAERSQTASFQLKALINQLLKAADSLGVVLLPKAIALINALTRLVQWFDSLSPAAKEVAVNLGLTAGAITLLGGGLIQLLGGLASITTAFKTVTTWLGAIKLAAGAATASEAELAAAGIAALGPASLWVAGIAAAALAIYGIVKAFQAAGHAQDEFAKRKLDAYNAVHTDDVKTNIGNQIGENNQEVARQQSLVDQLKADSHLVLDKKDGVEITQRGGGTAAQEAAQNAKDIAELQGHIAAINASTQALQEDAATSTTLNLKKRNYQRLVENATESQAQITKRLAELDKTISAYSGVHISSTRQMVALAKLQAERVAQQRNYDALEQDKKKNQKSADYLGTLESKELSQHSGIGLGMETGAAIAKIAWQKQISLDRAAYNDGCQRLARETVQAVTPAFNKYFGGTALESLRNFQKAGLALPYTPGMSIPAGSLLYSETMGRRGKKLEGHVGIEGEGGHYVDQHGTDTYALKNFQYYVPPPGGTVDKYPGLPSYMNPSGTARHWGGTGDKSGKGKGVGGLYADSMPIPLDTELAPANAAIRMVSAYEQSLGALGKEEAKEIEAARQHGTALDVLKAKIAGVNTLLQADKDTASINSRDRGPLVANQTKTYALYAGQVATANKIIAEQNAYEEKLNRQKEAGIKVSMKEAATLNAYKEAVKAAKAPISAFHQEAKLARDRVEELDHALEAANRNLLTHQDKLTTLIASQDAEQKRLALGEIADLRSEGKGGALGSEVLMAQLEQRKQAAADSVGIGDLAQSHSAAELLIVLTNMKEQTDARLAAEKELQAVIAAEAAEGKRTDADNLAALKQQYKAIVDNKSVKDEDKLTILQGNSSYASLPGYADEIVNLQQKVTTSAATEGLKQNKIDRDVLVQRVSFYGLDHDAFVQALSEKSAALADAVVSDGSLEGASQQEILDKVRARITAELAGQTQMTASEILLDQQRLQAIEQNYGTIAQQKAKWARDEARQNKETERIWQETTKHISDTLANDLTDMLNHHKKHMSSLKDLWRDTFTQIEKEIVQKFVESAVLDMARVLKIPGTPGLASGTASGGSVSSGGFSNNFSIGGALGIASTIGSLFGGGTGSQALSIGSGSSSGGATAWGGTIPTIAVQGMGLSSRSMAASASSMASASTQQARAAVQGAGGKVSGAVGTVGQATGAVSNIGTLGGGLSRVFGSGLGGALGKALPMVGAALGVFSLLSSLMPTQKPDYITKAGASRDSTISGKDYTSSIDSGYSDTAGMRQLMAQHMELSQRVASGSTGSSSAVTHIHPGAIVVNGAADPDATAAAVMRKLATQTKIDNASHGSLT